MNLKIRYNFLKSKVQKDRTLKISIKIFTIFLVVALLSPFIANDKPLVCKYKGLWLFPAFSFKNQVIIHENESIETLNYNMGKEWKLLATDFSIFSICAYSPNTIDAENAPRKSPFDTQYMTLNNHQTIQIPWRYRHWWGTTQNGNDVLSCIIHGTKISLGIGILSMLIASFIGILLGSCAGYFENNSFKIGIIQLLFLITGIFLVWFYIIIVREDRLLKAFNEGGWSLIIQLGISLYIAFKILVGFMWLGKLIDKKIKTDKKLHLPIDTLVSRSIEILNSIPALLLIIAISAIAKPSYTLLILIIGFLSWTNIARLMRAECLKAKHLDYIASCKAIGMNDYRILTKHIIINALPILMVQVIFGMAGAVLAEASLSFIGIGVPINTISWGRLLNEGRDYFSSWWLVVFPGFCIFLLIYIYNIIASSIAKRQIL